MRRSGWTKWLIVIPAMLGIVLVTYVRYTTDIWGFGAFICQLIAILELAYGLRIAMLAQNRKKSYRLTPEERQARRERSEKIKREVRERLRKQGLFK